MSNHHLPKTCLSHFSAWVVTFIVANGHKLRYLLLPLLLTLCLGGGVSPAFASDTDGDGVDDVVDIDDDNDGVRDSLESPACFADPNATIQAVTSSLTNWNTNSPFEQLYDGNTGAPHGAYGVNGTDVSGETVLEFELSAAAPVESFTIDYQYSLFQSAAVFKWQGYDGATWTDLTAEMSETQKTNNSYTYTLTLHAHPECHRYHHQYLLGYQHHHHRYQYRESCHENPALLPDP